MRKLRTQWSTLLLIFIVLVLVAACSTTPAEPTIDANLIYTEAAKTVAAQLTNEAPPTLEPTITPVPTNTQAPTITETPEQPTATETPQDEGTEVTETPLPTATLNSGGNELIDQASLLTFHPPDDQIYTPGGVFDAQVGFKNTGPNTWNKYYSMRYLSGNTFGVGSKYTIELYSPKDTVEPEEDVVITIPGMTAPQEEGRYTSNWCFYNNREDQGLPPQCFYLITFQIIVENR